MYLISFWVILGCNYQKDSNANIKRNPCNIFSCIHGGIVRGDSTKKALSIVFTGGDFADGGEHIISVGFS